jgi:hypothetical protein
MIKKRRTLCLGLTCLLTLVVTGCAVETSTMYKGNSPSPKMSVVALQKGGDQIGTWETFDIKINYKYVQSGETLDISGQAVLSQHYQMGYNSITRLFIYLFFLDENSRVLKTARIAWAGTGATDEVMPFSQQYAVPVGAKSISFGYDGTAREYREINSFYELPLRSK